VRTIPVLLFVILTLARAASSQSLEVHGSAGPTLVDEGNSFAAGVGFPLHPRLTLLVNVERTHTASRTTNDRGVVSNTRGGTLLLGSAELRILPFGRSRVGPYGLAGVAAGVSKLNVNAVFPTPVTNTVQTVFMGGGLQVPIGERLTAFADGRFMFGVEGPEGIIAVAPVRAGLSWRF
jgi:hypothetical protein